MNEAFHDHPSEEALERFLLNMSAEEEIESVETHVLACGRCVEQLETLETQIAATRIALQTLEAQRNLKGSVAESSSWRSWFTLPRFSLAAIGAVAALGILSFSIPREVSITAYRGTETVTVSEGRPLHMHLNAAGLNPGAITVELTDRKGSAVWRGASVVQNEKVDVTLPRIFQSGAHYLRLYSQAGSESVLVREFALSARWTLE
jgi:hypothetical protein